MTSKCLRQNNKTQNTKKTPLSIWGPSCTVTRGLGGTEPPGNESGSAAGSNRNVFGSTLLAKKFKSGEQMCGKCEGNEELGEDGVLLGSGGGEASGGRFWNVRDVYFMCSGVLVVFFYVFVCCWMF